ncbi:vitamin B12 transporter [Cupriavidus gilardii J11]|uniref:Vitamin B12 transporter n=1 Tax=Cupriavidus gilardii J11 TaxID=936133 RepID=A0A562B513_9BURK|nr:TonB-dependent receptor [Cupriavidus gilardii]TWG80262.1 vitamin B12 transporter [Cupriavidus gilardii J11]
MPSSHLKSRSPLVPATRPAATARARFAPSLLSLSRLRPAALGALAMGGWLHAGHVSAQAAAPASGSATLAPVVVSAARTTQPLEEALPHTTVITRQDITDSQAPDLRSLLRAQAGVELTTTGGMGANTTLFMRGANSNQTLILIDGVRIASASSGTAQLANILPDEIDHIEIVRGNVSALYGSDAIGGVVQIFTKSGAGKAPAANAQVEYGSDNTRRGTVGYGGQVGDTSFNVTGSVYKTDGFSAVNTRQNGRANPDDNGYENKSVSGQIKHRFAPGWDAGVSGYYSKSELSYDSTFGRPTDRWWMDSELYTLSAFVNGKLTDAWTTHFRVAQSEDNSDNTLNGEFDSRFNTRNRQYTWQNEYALTSTQQLLFGAEYLQQSFDSNSYQAPQRNVASVFGGYEGRFGKHQLQLNLRNDHYSDFGDKGTYFAGYGYDLTPALKLLANASNAFRAPTFNELYYPNYGQPGLNPERARSVEVGAQYKTDRAGLLRVTAFRTQYDNLITSALQPSGLYLAQNVNRAKVEGVEASWRARVLGTDVGASVTFQNPVDEQTGTQLLRRARRHAAFDIGRDVGSWRFGGQWIVSSARMDTGSRKLGGYGIVNLNARYNIDKQWFIAARVENVFDKDYQLAYPYNTQGRAAFVTLGWRQR